MPPAQPPVEELPLAWRAVCSRHLRSLPDSARPADCLSKRLEGLPVTVERTACALDPPTPPAPKVVWFDCRHGLPPVESRHLWRLLAVLRASKRRTRPKERVTRSLARASVTQVSVPLLLQAPHREVETSRGLPQRHTLPAANSRPRRRGALAAPNLKVHPVDVLPGSGQDGSMLRSMFSVEFRLR